jgi:AcrR family transcriptional regulator
MEIRERILWGATEMFLKEGVRRVTMDNLATSLGVSKRTIYEIFSNKDELLKECIITHTNHQKEENARLALESETALHFFITVLNKGVQNIKSSNPQFVNDVRIYHPKIWTSIICANMENNVLQTKLLIQKGIDEGVFRNDFDIPIISKFFVETFSLLVNQDIFPIHTYAPAKLFKETLLTLIRGISSSKGLEIIDQLVKQEN